MTTLQRRLENAEERAGTGEAAEECACKARFGGWVEVLLGENDPDPAPICPDCGQPREVRCIRIAEEIVEAGGVP